ncbi:hypothetical protein H8R29_18505 [Priestia megaterium]|uniref:Uncharacterized protein n=1 Tax=Priestia megaterium (strain ATCC 14581 / DSM 32 / CCUG 1817 / JCM 2506 / NBRC 15308 / NCIMB 9376 / NCTC 10342 / NRRL B-14308 / VKM B-512 / Ford 19) TaxID=1348623 RepID=A0A0B6AID7_PRIM2|nr:hypothetical protein [Priestia megaterium]AJI20358.1 hypothetical protein BG04_426 [Priestia megaterium NBRC 15308 = ATCC 14581]KFN04802.1 hypothetical protein DJ91_3273 [Priestia megaterium]KGJ84375.1 hypothetical protein BMT_11045 [Priestia megaterium NBRC 15308 = ATCC 14581]MDR4234788.1 hypothetical protein [Priestia megaterium]MED3809891.1 hypothetical protein [Priestia megaterium]
MNHFLNEISKDLTTTNVERYWPNFELVAYALYDKNSVFLFNHPRYDNDPLKLYKVLKWKEQFVGNTLILFDGYPTAIADMELYDDYEGLFSILIHELFHGNQYIKEEKRFPDEMLGITYPLTKENVEIRNRERKSLYNALLETDISKKKQYLNEFISLREKRAEGIKEHLTYENLIESVEGPAWYVEIKAFSEKSPLANDLVLERYGKNLINAVESTSNIRRSCYSSGLFMCLLLDELSPDWKESFLGTKTTLFELIKFLDIAPRKQAIEEVQISPETEAAVNFAIESRKKELDEFAAQIGTHLFIEGEIIALSFDPMNIVPFENRLLHKNYIKVRINNQEYLIQQPSLTYCADGLKNINKLLILLKDKPLEMGDSLLITGIGEIKGQYTIQGDTINLVVN